MLSDIHQLIHSLTKAEKRYFQRSASLHVIGEKNNYLKLFDALNKQKQLNENVINHEFKEQHLYLLKRHLQKSILKSLRIFHSASSTAIRIHTMINEVEVLYKKGLIKAALKLVHHAKKIAERHELHLAAMQLLEWEIKLLSLPHKLITGYKKIGSAFEESKKQISIYKNFLDCFHIRMDVNALHKKEIILHKSDEVEEQKRLEYEIKKMSAENLSNKAQWQLYNGAGTFYSTIGNYSQSYRYHKKAANISKKNNSLVNDELRQHILSFYSQSISFYYLKKYDEALSNLKILNTIFSSLPNTANTKNIHELYLHTLLLEGFILMDMNNYKNALPVMNELKKEMNANISSVSASLRNDFYYQQTGFWFCIGDFKQSQTWITKMLQDEDAPKENPARYRFARLMQLLVLFEMNEFRQIENLVPATKKFLRKKNQHYKIEDAILNFIFLYARSKKMHSKKYSREKFSELKKKLLKISKDKNEAQALRIFDYTQWAKSKIENKTISEISK